MENASNSRKVIEVRKSLIGPPEPKQRNVRVRKRSDYPQIPEAILDVAEKLSSPLLMGPPICDELIDFVRHVFTDEEAALVRHLSVLPGRSAAVLAKKEHRPLDEVTPILDRLAFQKNVIASTGSEEKRKYHLVPIVGGIFEFSLIAERPESLTDWHRRLAERFEVLFETGYATSYSESSPPVVRYLPVHRSIDAHPMALPSDQLESILDRYDLFGVGQCQCRMTMEVLGKGCGKPLTNCTVMGKWAEPGIAKGWLRQVSRQDVLEFKREAEAHGMVNWMMNVASSKGQSSCSCCGCCCHAMRVVSEYNAPGLIAPPHFLPVFDREKCSYCGKCAKHCPMGAISVDTQALRLDHQTIRCVGCGLCQVACENRRAVKLEPVPEYRRPFRSWFSLFFHAVPGLVRQSWKAWKGQRES